jgi:hypothetical protein
LEDIVEYDQPTGADQGQAPLLGGVVALLVGIQEREIEAARFPRGQERVEGLHGRGETELDARLDPCLAPVPAGDAGEFLADVTGEEAAVRGWKRREKGSVPHAAECGTRPSMKNQRQSATAPSPV